MENLKLDFVQLNKALKTLSNALILLEDAKVMNHQGILLAAEDSIIQRFEYCYESFWKFLKKYLEQLHRLEDIASSKKVFRACVRRGICTLEEGNLFIDMADSRNETSHTYSIEAARVILSVVPHYYSAMLGVVTRFNKEFEQKERT